MVFLELRRDIGVYSRVTVGMALQNSCLFHDVRLLSSYEGHLRNLFEAWQANINAPRGEAGDPGSLSSCLSDIGIPIHVQEELGMATF